MRRNQIETGMEVKLGAEWGLACYTIRAMKRGDKTMASLPKA
jgi:hypothetical protein